MTEHRERTLSPAKAGTIYGKFKPSPLGQITVKTADGKTKTFSMNREERRRLARSKK